MIYDPENREVYFSTEMTQSEADANASYEHFKAYQQECIKNPGRVYGDIKNILSGPLCAAILSFVASVALFIILLNG